MIKAILKRIAPDFLLYQWRQHNENKQQQQLNNLREVIISYLESNPNDMTDEKQAVLDYLKHHPLSVFPSAFTAKYNPEDIRVYMDKDKRMRYVLQDNKRLYFPKGWDEYSVRTYYNGLLVEQDVASPHLYETPDFHVSEGDVVVDAGVAEGNFALSVVERAKELYLFEPDKKWIEPLEATFSSYGNKINIINSCVSDKWLAGGGNVTMDKFFENKKVDFIKADIEGAELQLLEGAKAILSRQAPMKVVLCTYHSQNDADVLNQMLTEKGFHTEFSKGYMIFHYDKLKSPYLRRGLIRAVK
jgi:hypothetical protein